MCYNGFTIIVNLSKRFKDGRGTYKNTGYSHLNVPVEQLVACGLSEISLQLEFQRLTKEMTLQNTEGNDTGTKILTNSSRSGGSIDSVRVRQ